MVTNVSRVSRGANLNSTTTQSLSTPLHLAAKRCLASIEYIKDGVTLMIIYIFNAVAMLLLSKH
jgi:hypothetical protein